MKKIIEFNPKKQTTQEQPIFKREHLHELYERYKNNIGIEPYKNIRGKEIGMTIKIMGPGNITIGKVVLFERKNNIWYISDLVIGKFSENETIFRNLGFAKALMKYVVNYTKSRGGKKLIFTTTLKLIPFYERLGAKRDKILSHSLFEMLFGLYPMSFDLTTYNSKNYL